MLDDPDDHTPESRFTDSATANPGEIDPDSLGPDVPTTPPAESVDPELQRTFWVLVVVFNVAILGVSLGLMLTVLSTYTSVGVIVTIGGVSLFGVGVYRYRRFMADR